MLNGSMPVPAAPPGGPPPNDSCGTVVPEALAVGDTLTFAGDNTGADTVGDALAGTLLDGYGPNVWHIFTTTECADVTVSYCGTTPVFGNVWNLLATTCPADNALVYATGFDNTSCPDGNRTTFYDDLPAGTYYLPVLLDPFSSMGPYTIDVAAAPCVPPGPVNDECASVVAQALNVGGSLTFTGDNTGADSVGDALAGTLLDDYEPNVWHLFTTTECADVTLSYCGTTPVFGNVWNLLATTCPADNALVYATSFNNSDCPDGNWSILFNDLPAGTYYLPVYMDPFSSMGPYTIEVAADPCVPPGPVNDDCANVVAQDLNVGGTLTFTGDNTGADTLGDAEPGTLIDSYGAAVWHLFTTTECADVTIDYCGGAIVFANYWNLLATTCPANDSLVYASGTDDTTCVNGSRTIFFNDLPAGTYYLPVLTDPFSVGPYSIEVSAASCTPQPPPNDLCDDTAPEVLLLNDTLTFTGDNSLATSTNDAEPGTVLDNAGLPVVWHAFSTSECMSVTIDYCGTTPPFGNWYDLLATTCPATDVLVYADSANDVTCLDGNHTVFFSELPAGVYFYPVLQDPFSNASGPYTVNVMSDSCMTTGLEGRLDPGVIIYPNPGSGQLVIAADPGYGLSTIELVDATGATLITRRAVLDRAHPLVIGTSGIASGAYVLRLTGASGTLIRKVVVN